MKTVLFVCSHNSIRSPMAQAIYNQYAKKSQAISAGIEPAGSIKATVTGTLMRHGVSSQGLRVRRLNQELLASADKVVFLTRHHDGFSPPGALEWDVDIPETADGYDKLFSLLKKKVLELVREVDGA
ncbi:MAG: low molecular weight phosphatase family protein [Candidatus Micrarchaeota archaeon]